MKKLFALLLTLAMVLCMFAGCGGSSTEPTAAADSAAATEASAPAEAPEAPADAPEAAPAEASAEEAASAAEESEAPAEKEIVHLIDFPIDEDFAVSVSMSTTPSLTGSALVSTDGSQLGWATWLEARTGADIQVDLYSFLDSNDKLNLMIASGDYSDIIVGMFNYAGGIDGAVEEGVLTNIDEYAEYIPDYLNVLYQNIDNVAAAYSTENNLTAFYGINDPEAKAEYGPVLRQDWLEELGLEAPVTYDDLHEVLTAFRDKYGATMWVTSYGGVPGDFSGGYGVMEYAGGAGFPTWTEDGQFKFAPLADGFRDYITMMHQWYTEDLIYADFISQGGSDYPDSTLINNGDIGVWTTYVSYLEAEQDMLSASDAKGQIGAITWPVVEAGQTCNPATYGKAPNNAGVDGMGGFSVTTACEDIELLCAIFNEFYTEEGHEFANWGIEGETYTLEADGSHAFTELITDDEYNLGANIMMTYYFFKDGPFAYDSRRYLASYSDMQLNAANLWTTGSSSATTSTLTTEQSYELNSAKTDISTVYQEYTVKFITGDMDIDTQWDEFIQKLNDCGLDTFMELGQIGIDQYAERMDSVQELYDSYMNS